MSLLITAALLDLKTNECFSESCKTSKSSSNAPSVRKHLYVNRCMQERNFSCMMKLYCASGLSVKWVTSVISSQPVVQPHPTARSRVGSTTDQVHDLPFLSQHSTSLVSTSPTSRSLQQVYSESCSNSFPATNLKDESTAGATVRLKLPPTATTLVLCFSKQRFPLYNG